MKNLRTSAKVSLMILAMGIISSVQVMANETSISDKEKKEAKYLAELKAESELDKMGRELVEAGVILCDNITIVKILDEKDEIIYQGELNAFDTQDPELKKWMGRADFLLNVDNTSFYKIF
ncbi:hypothetical protein JKA74_05790 [Marivirga sp. S37H4]|uniref:Uncharacterized protein n=1 Tax=Marivirga aurantiaca TaxID=2802615 RepID=A0A934WWT2_9BACT|nr:hypothetical protein [Marivirga aurantiaca]MBK6264543.1 hypothetical protein [Marivirga aurantiaca]